MLSLAPTSATGPHGAITVRFDAYKQSGQRVAAPLAAPRATYARADLQRRRDLCVPYKGNEELVTNLETAGSLVEKAPWQPWYAERLAAKRRRATSTTSASRQDVSIEWTGCILPHDPPGGPHGPDLPTRSRSSLHRALLPGRGVLSTSGGRGEKPPALAPINIAAPA